MKNSFAVGTKGDPLNVWQVAGFKPAVARVVGEAAPLTWMHKNGLDYKILDGGIFLVMQDQPGVYPNNG